MRDEKLILSDAQDMSSIGTGDNPSEDVIDLGAAGAQVGGTGQLVLVVSIAEDVNSGGSATLSMALQESSDNGDSDAFADTSISVSSAGYDTYNAGDVVIKQALPVNTERYLRMNYNVGTAALTGGKVDAWIEFMNTN
jgi:hypothetical protein